MKLSDDLVKKLQQKYEPSTMVNLRYRGNDIAFKTDGDGNAIQLFVGKKNEEGMGTLCISIIQTRKAKTP